MKHKLAVLLAVLLCAGTLAPVTAQAIWVSIHYNDRPYYNHGAWYYHNGARWYWSSGYWAWRHHRRVWIPGHYAPRHRYH